MFAKAWHGGSEQWHGYMQLQGHSYRTSTHQLVSPGSGGSADTDALCEDIYLTP